MEILTECSAKLGRLGYKVAPFSLLTRAGLCFEDDSLMGFVWVDEIAQILANWEIVQDEFINLNAHKLRRSPTKTWNLYMICLSSDQPSSEQQVSIAQIQENFRGTRKIVQGGIVGDPQLVRALYPLIRIQNLVELDGGDAAKRLRSRLAELPNSAVTALVADGLPDDSAVTEFLSAHDIKAN